MITTVKCLSWGATSIEPLCAVFIITPLLILLSKTADYKRKQCKRCVIIKGNSFYWVIIDITLY